MKKQIIAILGTVVFVMIALLSFSPLASTMADNTADVSDVDATYTNCSQETTNSATSGDCATDISYAGTYTFTAIGTCQDQANAYDGDPSTEALVFPSAECLLTSNYTIPTSLTGGATYQHTTSANTYVNVTVPDACLTGTVLSLQIYKNRTGDSYTACYNGSEYLHLTEDTLTANSIAEENVFWGTVEHSGNNYPLGTLFGTGSIVFLLFTGVFLIIIVGVILRRGVQ